MIIYLVTNMVNDKMYVGQTIRSLAERRTKHIYASLTNKDNGYFHNALRVYGVDNFKWEIVHNCSNTNILNLLEIFYIGYYDTFNNGYNLNAGGKNASMSEETRAKISGENHPMYGKHHTIETKKKMSLSHSGKNNPNYGKLGKDSYNYGRKHTAETKLKISKAHVGFKHSVETKLKMCGENNSMYGKTVSKETKKKISLALKGKNNPNYGKRGKDNPNYGKKRSVEIIQKTSGKNSPVASAVIINNKYFYTLNEAAEFVGIHHSSLRYRILNKKRWPGYKYV